MQDILNQKLGIKKKITEKSTIPGEPHSIFE
jgi:hypothetical protein